ncbi:MAG: CDP-alcohol phosphatidyltransferase family protein [Candidatus Thermoplasmatota archaeon]|nr:CDP-alcohol phosphatidyltransferase family protein [Candidatus Thermoplasmatota archaeon]
MVLEMLRTPFGKLLDPLVLLFRNVHPNVFSVLSLVFSIVAGVLYGSSNRWAPSASGMELPFLLLIAAIFVILNSIADSLDGRIARFSNRASKLGDFLDHSFDRLSDIAILAGIAFSGFCDTTFGLLTVVSVLLSSYMGTQAQAVNVGRDYSGIMGRADRMVLLLFASAMQFLVIAGWGAEGWDPLGVLGHRISVLEMLMGIMLIGGIFTTFQRGYQTYIALRRISNENSERPPRNADQGRIERKGRRNVRTVDGNNRRPKSSDHPKY